MLRSMITQLHWPGDRVYEELSFPRQAPAPYGFQSKRACLTNVLYLAHQLWELIPPSDAI